MHMQGLVGGWLPVINQGLRDTNGGSAVEQLILASGDSLFLGNRSGTVDDGWGHWSFYSTGGPENQTRLQQVTPGQFVTALLLVVEDAREFIDGTALSESRLQIPAEPWRMLLVPRCSWHGQRTQASIHTTVSARRTLLRKTMGSHRPRLQWLKRFVQSALRKQPLIGLVTSFRTW